MPSRTFQTFTNVMAGAGGSDFNAAAAGWNTANGLNGSINATCTSAAHCDGGMAVRANVFDDGTLPPVIVMQTVVLQFNWEVTANQGGNGYGTFFNDNFVGHVSFSAPFIPTGSGILSSTVHPPSDFAEMTRAQFFSAQFGWDFTLGNTGGFNPGPFTGFVTAASVTLTYTIPATESITGSGGVQVGGNSGAAGGALLTSGTFPPGPRGIGIRSGLGGAPPELRGSQWGMMRFELRPSPEQGN
jgi:hypothetical protein